MSGAWSADTCVQYVEWCNGKPYKETVRTKQIESARKLHKEDEDVTLAQFKLAYDDWRVWWQSKSKGSLHVSDLMVKQDNGFYRYRTALDRIEARCKVIPIRSSSTPPTTEPKKQLWFVDEEINAARIARLRAKYAEQQAAQQAAAN